MDIRTEIKKMPVGNGIYARMAMERVASRLIKATEQSEEAKKEVLYSLPGIFAVEIRSGANSVRLIKEGDVFREMESSEKSDILLVVIFQDQGAETAYLSGAASLARLYAEGRLSSRGRGKYRNAFMRIARVADETVLSKKKLRAMYGSER